MLYYKSTLFRDSYWIRAVGVVRNISLKLVEHHRMLIVVRTRNRPNFISPILTVGCRLIVCCLIVC